jgi:hypothetical protein
MNEQSLLKPRPDKFAHIHKTPPLIQRAMQIRLRGLNVYESEAQEALRDLRDAAQLGSGFAAYKLGTIYRKGWKCADGSIKPDRLKMMAWFMFAVELEYKFPRPRSHQHDETLLRENDIPRFNRARLAAPSA